VKGGGRLLHSVKGKSQSSEITFVPHGTDIGANSLTGFFVCFTCISFTE